MTNSTKSLNDIREKFNQFGGMAEGYAPTAKVINIDVAMDLLYPYFQKHEAQKSDHFADSSNMVPDTLIDCHKAFLEWVKDKHHLFPEDSIVWLEEAWCTAWKLQQDGIETMNAMLENEQALRRSEITEQEVKDIKYKITEAIYERIKQKRPNLPPGNGEAMAYANAALDIVKPLLKREYKLLTPEAEAVIWAARRLINSDIMVYPNMSRADAVNSGLENLERTLNEYEATQPAQTASENRKKAHEA